MLPSRLSAAPSHQSVRCLACRSGRVRRHRPSRATAGVVDECRQCGALALATRPEPEDVGATYEWSLENYSAYMSVTRKPVMERGYREVVGKLAELVPPGAGRSLFDVGAGDGSFLAEARAAGFEPGGNELAPGAVALAKQEHDIDLNLGDLSTLTDLERQDAVTMWCVLAHVHDHDALLRQVFALLKPGGALYLQTPRRAAMDSAGLRLLAASRGRFSRVTDRRLAGHHMILHTADSIRQNLARIGYEVLEVSPRVRYSLDTALYLKSLRLPHRAIGRAIDGLLAHELFFRNVLDVYARKPAA